MHGPRAGRLRKRLQRSRGLRRQEDLRLRRHHLQRRERRAGYQPPLRLLGLALHSLRRRRDADEDRGRRLPAALAGRERDQYQRNELGDHDQGCGLLLQRQKVRRGRGQGLPRASHRGPRARRGQPEDRLHGGGRPEADHRHLRTQPHSDELSFRGLRLHHRHGSRYPRERLRGRHRPVCGHRGRDRRPRESSQEHQLLGRRGPH